VRGKSQPKQTNGVLEGGPHRREAEAVAEFRLGPAVVDSEFHNLDKETCTGHARLWTKGTDRRCSEDGAHRWIGGSNE
jgi:hypothetical protein